MKYSFSSESDIQVSENLSEIEFLVVDLLQPLFATKSLKHSNIEVCYIPIVMSSEDLEQFPERSEINKKDDILFCAPQLSYNVFVGGTFNERLREYLNGLLNGTPEAIRKLGATDVQLQDFASVVEECFSNLKK